MRDTPLRILTLVHASLVPPDSIVGLSAQEVARFKMEFDVTATLREMGHEVAIVGVGDDSQVIREAVREHRPDVVVNLMEEFAGVGVYDSHVAAYLEMLGVPYTGCNPRGLMLAHHKAWSKAVLRAAGVPVPRFATFPLGGNPAGVRLPRRLAFPMIVKSLTEEGSVAIAQASVVRSAEALYERVAFVHRTVGTHAIAEEYIDGRELYAGVLGNEALTTLPIWELRIPRLRTDAPMIATDRMKWDNAHQQRVGLETGAAELGEGLARRVGRIARRTYRGLHLSGYARVDLRLDAVGTPYVLEANPNPQLAYGEDFAESAHHGGIEYESLLEHILELGMAYRLHGMT